ncbi:hypothetical protein D9M69_484900 [compost metagenome]
MLEGLIVRQVARPGPCQYGTHQPRELTPHTTRRLDIFRSPFWLAVDCHNSQPVNVDPDRQHVGGQYDIDGSRISFFPTSHVLTFFRIPLGLEHHLKLVEILGNVLVGNTRSQLTNIHNAALRQTRPLHHAHLYTVRTSLHVILGQTLHTAQLA